MTVKIPKSYGDYVEFDENPADEIIEGEKKKLAKMIVNEMIDNGEDLNNYLFDYVVHLKPEHTMVTVGFKAVFKKENWTNEQKQALADHRAETHRKYLESQK